METAALQVEEIVRAENVDHRISLVKDSNFPTRKNLYLNAASVWRCHGWLENADIPHGAKHLMLLHTSHHLTYFLLCIPEWTLLDLIRQDKWTLSEQEGMDQIRLYTCCVVRAVHLNIVPDLSTQPYIQCLKQFTARRGLPCIIVSDNGKTFKAAAEVISAVMKYDDVQQYLSGVGVEWTFNVEWAPSWDGVFERMVKEVSEDDWPSQVEDTIVGCDS